MSTHLSPRCLDGLPLLAAVLLVGCGEKGPRLAEAPPPAVTISKPLQRPVTNFDEFEGRIAPERSVEVRAQVRGYLTKVAFEDGQMVEAGKLLFQIDPRNFEFALKSAEAELKSATAAHDLALAEQKRVRLMIAKGGAASREEQDVWVAKGSTAAADQLKANQAIEQAKVDLEHTRITARISGKISRAQVNVGALVNAGGGETLLTTIVSVDPVYVYFDVDERSLLRYRKDFRKERQDKGQDQDVNPPIKELKIPVEVALEGEDGYPHKGVLDFADNRVNPSTGTISVRGVLSNKSRIFEAGMRARVRVPVSTPYKALLITDRSVGTDQGLKFVYVVTSDNVAKRRDVVLGRLFDGLRVIDKGLEPDDQVNINGIQYVRPEMKVDPKPGEMPGAKLVAKP